MIGEIERRWALVLETPGGPKPLTARLAPPAQPLAARQDRMVRQSDAS
jgi:hypothetical protein